MPPNLTFRAYLPSDRAACLALFARNCPAYFAPNEEAEYAGFLEGRPPGYEVCLLDERVVGAFGVLVTGRQADLRWILLDPGEQRRGIGTAIMHRAFDVVRRQGRTTLAIAASHRSAPFFARFGARQLEFVADGWGPGMHRVNQVVEVGPAPPETR